MPPCCSDCAPGGLGDVEGGGAATAGRKPLMLLAGSLGGLALLLWLFPEKRRRRAVARVRYYDSQDRGSSRSRATQELPAFEPMSDVVFQRRR